VNDTLAAGTELQFLGWVETMRERCGGPLAMMDWLDFHLLCLMDAPLNYCMCGFLLADLLGYFRSEESWWWGQLCDDQMSFCREYMKETMDLLTLLVDFFFHARFSV